MTAPHTTGTVGTPASTGTVSRPAWAHYLVELRNRRNLRAQDVAARLAITPSTYAGIEAGARTRNGKRSEVTVQDDTVHRIIEALDLSVAEARHLITLITTSAGNRSPWQNRLRLARITAGLSAAQAAASAGVAADTYREWERKGTGAPRHEHLRLVLAALGWSNLEVDEFMATVPPDTAPARAPRQPTNPVGDLPDWSAFITETRLAAGLYLRQVDERIGQQSIVRRFELGGWPRTDGRLSVPASDWLDRVVDALAMTPDQAARLHLLADQQRVALAQAGADLHARPLLAELLHEARKSTTLSRAQANTHVGLPAGTWSRAEAGDPVALAAFTSPIAETLIEDWRLGTPLDDALRANVAS